MLTANHGGTEATDGSGIGHTRPEWNLTSLLGEAGDVQQSMLILSKPGVGKTTLLRDLAAMLARDGPDAPRVIVVDTSNEIGGDSHFPLPYLGRARRFQVPRRTAQGDYLLQVVQNHTPDIVIIDEIANETEAYAAMSVANRGVKLIATAHGDSLQALLNNRQLNHLVGGAVQAFLSHEERRLRSKIRKTVLERPNSSPFGVVVELESRDAARVIVDVDLAVDMLLDDIPLSKKPGLVRRVELGFHGAQRTTALTSPADTATAELPHDQAISRDPNAEERRQGDVDLFDDDLRGAVSALQFRPRNGKR